MKFLTIPVTGIARKMTGHVSIVRDGNNTLIVSVGKYHCSELRVKKMVRSKDHILIHCKGCDIVISYLTGYMYMYILDGDNYTCIVESLRDVSISLGDDIEQEESLLSELQAVALHTCINHVSDEQHVDTSKIPITTELGDLCPEISPENLSDYLDSEDSAMGYAYLLYLYKQYGISALEYLYVL